jgi:hypothetical protein
VPYWKRSPRSGLLKGGKVPISKFSAYAYGPVTVTTTDRLTDTMATMGPRITIPATTVADTPANMVPATGALLSVPHMGMVIPAGEGQSQR